MTRGRGGSGIRPKSDDVIYEQPLRDKNMDLTWQFTKLSFLRLLLSHSPRASFITVKHRNTCKLSTSISFIWVDLTAVHFSVLLTLISRDHFLPFHHGIKFSV